MSVLKSLESKIAGVVEGTFSRVFRSEVRPVEIARKLAREMEEHQYGTLSRTYVPNEYRVYLSPRDRERFDTYEEALADELAGYLLEHARRERFALLSRPVIEFETDERLGLGEFGIETAVVQPEERPEPDRAARDGARSRATAGGTMVFSAAQRLAEPLEETATRASAARAADLRRPPPGRRRPRARRSGAAASATSCSMTPTSRAGTPSCVRAAAPGCCRDLGSTNGTRLNGRTIEAPEVVRPGDEIEVGSSLITFELE